MVSNGRTERGESFAALFESCYPMVRAAAGRIVRDEQLAEDLAQEVFVKAYTKLGTLRDPDKIKSWLFTMAKRRAIDWLRKQRRQPEQVWTDRDYDAQTKLEEEVIRRAELQEALLSLDDAYRHAFLMHEWKGYTAREISQLTQESSNTIESRIRRARGKLRDYLAPLDDRRIMVSVAKPIAAQPRLIVPRREEFEKRLASQSILAVVLHLRKIAN